MSLNNGEGSGMITKHLGIKLQEVIRSFPCLAKEFGLYMDNKGKKFRMLLGGSMEDDLR